MVNVETKAHQYKDKGKVDKQGKTQQGRMEDPNVPNYIPSPPPLA